MPTRVSRLRKKFCSAEDQYGKATALKVVTDAGYRIDNDAFIVLPRDYRRTIGDDLLDAIDHLVFELDYCVEHDD